MIESTFNLKILLLHLNKIDQLIIRVIFKLLLIINMSLAEKIPALPVHQIKIGTLMDLKTLIIVAALNADKP